MARLIDADALIKQFDGFGFGGECDGEIVLEAVADAPTVDAVEVVHGRWIYEEDTVMRWTTKAICSACKCVVAHNTDLSHEYGIERHERRNKYCPNCGAKMDGDVNGAAQV